MTTFYINNGGNRKTLFEVVAITSYGDKYLANIAILQTLMVSGNGLTSVTFGEPFQVPMLKGLESLKVGDKLSLNWDQLGKEE
jgi:hypothetical protein